MLPRIDIARFAVAISLLLVLAIQVSVAQGAGTVKGKVVDATTGDGLPSANVIVVGTSIGTATDLDGNYILRLVPPGQLTLRASFVGYATSEVEIVMTSDATVEQEFRLSADVIEGEEVVVSAQALGQMQAINQQLASNKIATIVSEARIQELPDFNAAQAIGRLPGVSTLQSSGEANKIVIRGLAPQYNAVAVGGITLSPTGGTQIGVSSIENTSGRLNTDRSVDLAMITPYMIKSVEVFKSLTPDLNANAIGGYVNMNLREAPDGFKSDLLFQSGYTQKSGKYGNYRFVAAASDRFLDGALGVYVLGNAEQYDRDADNMNANYSVVGTPKPDGFRVVQVTSVELHRHIETRNRYGGNLILDYLLPAGSIKSVNVLSRLNSDSRDFRTILGYQSQSIDFRYREGISKTDVAVNSLEFNNDFGLFSVELKVANSYSRNYTPGSPQFDFRQDLGILGGTNPDVIPESLYTSVNYRGSEQTRLSNISLFSADFKANDQVYKGDFKVPFNVEGITAGYLKFGGEFRYNLRTNDQGTPYAGFGGGSEIGARMMQLIRDNFYLPYDDGTSGNFTANNFTASDSADLTSDFLNDRFGKLLWASGRDVLNGITNLLSHDPSINANNSTGTNPGGWFDGPYQRLPNKYKYIEKYTAGYVMSELNFGQALKVVGGFRWEEVKSLFDAFNLADGRNPSTQIVDSVSAHPWNRYWLPMVQTKWNVFDWADVRYSFTKTLARPDYHQLSPHFSMNVLRFEVRAGNPRLKPAEALNHDVFLTFHSNELGLLSIGGFYKEVRNFTFSTRYPLHPTSVYGLDTVGHYKVRSAAGGGTQFVSPNDGAFLNTYTNSKDPAYVRGFEIDLQTRLWYLPEPLNGTVLGVNYTRVYSKATYPNRYDTTIVIPATPRPITRVVTLDNTRDGRLINQPNHVLNAYVGYDYSGFSGRLSFLFQANAVNSIASNPEADGYTKDYFRVDVSARQKLPWFGLQMFLDIFNLNSRKNDAAQRSINGFTSQQHYGMTANLGLRLIL